MSSICWCYILDGSVCIFSCFLIWFNGASPSLYSNLSICQWATASTSWLAFACLQDLPLQLLQSTFATMALVYFPICDFDKILSDIASRLASLVAYQVGSIPDVRFLLLSEAHHILWHLLRKFFFTKVASLYALVVYYSIALLLLSTVCYCNICIYHNLGKSSQHPCFIFFF